MARRTVSHAEFFKLCQWLQALPKPVTGTFKKLAKNAGRELNCQFSEHAVGRACEAAGISIERTSGSDRPGRKSVAGSRLALLAKCLRAVVHDLEQSMGDSLLKPETRELLRLLAWDRGGVDLQTEQAGAKVPDPLENGAALSNGARANLFDAAK